ncbi:hypothetical protein GCM10028800_11910 [Nesterenkonia populi]
MWVDLEGSNIDARGITLAYGERSVTMRPTYLGATVVLPAAAHLSGLSFAVEQDVDAELIVTYVGEEGVVLGASREEVTLTAAEEPQEIVPSPPIEGSPDSEVPSEEPPEGAASAEHEEDDPADTDPSDAPAPSSEEASSAASEPPGDRLEEGPEPAAGNMSAPEAAESSSSSEDEGGLPRTGTTIAAVAGIALLLIGAGAVVLAVRHRKEAGQ